MFNKCALLNWKTHLIYLCKGDGLEKSTEQTAGDKIMSNKSKIARCAALILGTASAVLATDAFAANNYDSSDWAPMHAGPTGANRRTMFIPKH
jgi:hypothetical protein